ncbi:MAG: flagellar biosynthesis protein FlgL [Rhodobacterales bacterium]|nr:MAG: flagellar biosynthesis protein FlgL [Rhodobacterales bacterium]
MPMLSLGDMAQSFMLRHNNVRLSSEMTRLSQELTTGATSDVSAHLKGNFSYLGDIERSLRVLDSFQTNAAEAATFTDAMQLALDNVQTRTADLSTAMLTAGATELAEPKLHASTQARGDMQSLISALNTSVAGQSLFSGTTTNVQPLADADSMMADLRTAVTGLTTHSDIVAAVDDWFNTPGGGFETIGYLGSDTDLAAMRLSDEESVTLGLRADDDTFRNLLRDTALAALAADSTLGYSLDLQSSLLMEAGEGLLASQGNVTELRADLGYAQARIEEAETRMATEKTSLEYAKGELLGIDQFETATQLEAVQFQLESLYAVTVKLSSLSLVRYMQ